MWKTVKLGDVCKIVNGSTPLRKEKKFWVDGNVSWFTIDDMREQGRDIFFTKQHVTQAAVNEKKVKLIPANSVLLCCTASIGEVAIARKEMATNQQFNSLTPTIAELCCDYLYYVATTLKSKLLQSSGTTTISFLSMTKLKEIEIPLPPLAEQQRIVAKLDAAFVEIDKAVSVVEAKEIEVQQLKASLLSKVIDDQSTNLTPLGEVIKIARGGSPRPIKSFITDDDNGVNWIKIGDTEQGGRYIYRTKEKIKPSGVSRSRFVKEDDFLLSNSMSFGRPYILKTSGCIHDGWLVLSEYQKLFSSDYLYYLLSSSYVQNQFEFLAKGSTVRNLNIDLVSKVLVPIPSLEHQKKISEKLDLTSQKFEEYKHSILKNQMNYKLLKSSILSKEIQSGIAA